jgi:hypothetical protein
MPNINLIPAAWVVCPVQAALERASGDFMQTIRTVLACALLGAVLSSCSDDDGGDTGEAARVNGAFRDQAGSPMASTSVWVLLSDTTLDRNTVGDRTLTTNGAGHFSTTFTFDTPTLPVHVMVEGRPPYGSGMTFATEYDSLLTAPTGLSFGSLHYELTSITVEPSVIGIPAAALTREAIVGRYTGESVQPYDAFSGQVYIDSIVFRSGTGSDLGFFDFGYMATKIGGTGDVFGTIHDDTLFMQLSEVQPASRNTSYRVIATSVTADTLVAWPEPCGENCISKDSPIRLVRWP